MPRERPLALALLLASASLALPPLPGALAAGPLVADAGESRVAYDGEPLAVEGRAFGGQPPYAFAWSFEGSQGRFADPAASSTTFDTAGLPAGDFALSLAVTDAAGATATDTVLHRADVAPVVLRHTEATHVGLPDEPVGTGALDRQTRLVPFDLGGGMARLVVVLDWQNRDRPDDVGNDFDLELFSPVGERFRGQGETMDKPERVVVAQPAAGTWRARVKPFLSTPDEFTLTAQAFPAAPFPTARANGPYVFGSADPQVLRGTAAGGIAPLNVRWDLDLDGLYEAAGSEVTAALPPGAHRVAFKATDGEGHEARDEASVEVRADVERTLRLGCGGDATRPYWAMEFTASKGSCWMHGGHHTYFLGGPWLLAGGAGRVFSVEQQFSPPTEYAEPAPFRTPVRVEASLDGQAWHEVGVAPYKFLRQPLEEPAGLDTRQSVPFSLAASPEPFRFLRVAQPRSAAQGLSGFLDHSEADVLVAPAPLAPEPAPLGQGARELSCLAGDLIEDFFATHPCWFGGLNRYDAPSFFHTYSVAGKGAGAFGPASLSHVGGTFQVAPWRSDDWFVPVTLGNLAGWAAQVRETRVFVQSSVDGMAWETLAAVPATYGAPTSFALDLPQGKDARFVRLLPDDHPRFEEPGEAPSLHHPEAFFLFSALRVEGALPP